MCGITGYYQLNSAKEPLKKALNEAVSTLGKRGPDNHATYCDNQIGLGHTRLSIVDTSELGNQPMSDSSGRYTLVFNGEIYNYLELKQELPDVSFQSSCDTEVLLHLLIRRGADCLEQLNGFFALAFYDKKKGELLLARDRMGIKPLHYYSDKDSFFFASEMKALLSYPIARNINQEALYWYLKLNYLPGSLSMIKGVHKLEPGNFLHIKEGEIRRKTFWEQKKESESQLSYTDSQAKLVELLEDSVKKRLMADVPLGAFLSGGTDSSAIVSLASRHHEKLSTFSIGYRDHSFFDETHYAELVAKKFGTNHTTFSLTNDDLLNDLDSIINYIDEPFADSSAIPTYILSRHVSKKVKVALSGDGADELFGGYYKHLALNRSLQPSITNSVLKGFNPALSTLPQSRSGRWSNLFRRLDRYGKMMKCSEEERYWFLASLTNDPSSYLKQPIHSSHIVSFKEQYIGHPQNLNDYLDADLKVLLPGDMLTKVDLMSMANSLEVRVPFLDKEVVNFARSLPAKFKVNGSERKRIVQDAFREILPTEIYHRPKKGFEVPLLQWMQNELLSDLDSALFDQEYLKQQGLFESDVVMDLRKKLLSNNPGDVHGIIWALYVFQKWYSRYLS